MKQKPIGDALMNVFQALEAWVDALPVNWNASNATIQPLPPTLKPEDLRRVALYASTLEDVENLCHRIEIRNPKRSFSPLLLLSELISSPHPRLRAAVQRHLESNTVLHIALRGHAQCRESAGKLFLRLWGPLCPESAANVVNFLLDPLENLKSEAHLCVAQTAAKHPLQLYHICIALNACEYVNAETLLTFFHTYQRSENTHIKDSTALLLLWLLQKNLQQWTTSLSIEEILRVVVKQSIESMEVNVQLALLDGLSRMGTRNNVSKLIWSCGGVGMISKLLSSMRHCSFFHEPLPFHGNVETPFESIAKLTHHLAQHPDAQREIKKSDIPRQLADVTHDEVFLQHERSRPILEIYLQPIFSFSSATSSLP